VLKLERVGVRFFLSLLQRGTKGNKSDQPEIVLLPPEEPLALDTVGDH